MRLFFHRFDHRSKGFLNPARTVAQIKEQLRYTSPNSGNLVHLEALPKILRYQERSDNRNLSRIDDPKVRAGIETSYDGVVLQFSNMIRSYDHIPDEARERIYNVFRNEADWLGQTKLKIFALGIGMQDRLPSKPDAVPAELFGLLKVLNDRAEIFSVRGKSTEAWLHSIGLTKAKALGCPSLYVYPMNASRISAPTIESTTRVATAGRIQKNKDPNRLASVNRIGQSFPTSYVFQTDFFALFRTYPDDIPVYNEATGEVDRTIIQSLGKKFLKTDLAFESYHLFRSVEKWRGFASSRDIFFGDRFHGGVVFLQCGRPTILISNDARVGELADFYSIPVVQAGDLIDNDPIDVLRKNASEESFARFRRTYVQRLEEFYTAMKNVNLDFVNDAEFQEVIKAGGEL